MIRRGVADPVVLAIVEDRIVPTALELTRQLSGAWVEGAGRRSIGFSYQAIHERDHWCCTYCGRSVSKTPPCERSEEHTSELQSRGHLVCRLLLEKKKKQHKIRRNHARIA